MNKFFKLFIKRPKFTFSIAVLFLMACGPSYDWEQFTSYFQPEAANLVNKDDRSFQYSPDVFFQDYTVTENTVKSDSAQIISEWAKHFKTQDAASIADLLYNGEPLPALEKNEDVRNFINIIRSINAHGYEVYLKQFRSTKDLFMKERIGYQVMRTMVLSGNHKAVLEFYKNEFLPIATKSIVATKAQARAAGSMIFAGNKAQAFYEFAQIFDKNDSQRTIADLSVRTNQVMFSEEALSFCKTEHEKVAVYVLASLQPNQDALGFIEKIVAINPNHPMLEFLMAREINRNEYLYFSENDAEMKAELSYFEEKENTIKQKAIKAQSYFGKLANLAQTTAKQKVTTPAFWLVAASHCHYLDQNYAKSRTLLEEAKALKPTKIELQDQLILQEALLFTKENNAITAESEAKIVPIVAQLNERKNHRQTLVQVGTLRFLSSIYKGVSIKKPKKNGWFSSCSSNENTASKMPFANAKSLLFAYLSSSEFDKKDEYGYPLNYYQSLQNFGNLEDTTSAASADELVRFVQQSSPSDLDKSLIKLVDKEKLKETLARRLLAEQQYTKAAEAFKTISPKVWHNEKYKVEFDQNPFSLKIDRSNLADTNSKYSVVSFVEKMAELSSKTDAESLYGLACGAYNLSYFGNAWVLVRNSKSESDLDKGIGYYVNPYRDLKSDYYQLNTAQNYFEKALKSTSDRELQAKILYGMALIERARFDVDYAQNEPEYNFKEYEEASYESYETKREIYKKSMKAKKKNYSTNFENLKSQYADTQFQALLLKECSTYEHFVKK